MEKYKLSDMDKKILHFLISNGAQYSDAEIAKRLRLSPTTVNYKIKKLKDENIILDYEYHLNPYKLGYPFSAFCFIELSGEVDDMKEVIYNLLSYPNVFSLYVLGGNIDIIVKVYLTEKDYLGSFITWIGENLKSEVKRVSSSVITREYKSHQIDLDYSKKVKLNKKEKDLLNYRLAYPSKKVLEVAKDLGVHRNTVSAYWKRFWDEGVILKKAVVIDKDYFKDLEIDFESVVFTETTMGETEKVVDRVKNLNQVNEICSISSRSDLITFLKTGGVAETYSAVKKIYGTGKISHSNTFIVFRSYNKPFSI